LLAHDVAHFALSSKRGGPKSVSKIILSSLKIYYCNF
jgi:hypothetical protein